MMKEIETNRQKVLQPYALKQLKIALCLTIGNLTTGYSAGWMVPMVPKLQDPILTPLPYMILDAEASWIARNMVIGAIIGSIISGFAANQVGRKPTLILTSSFNLVGYAVLATAVDIDRVLLGRTIIGVAVGSIAVLNVVYLGEIATPKIRGSLIAMAGTMHVLGSILVYSLGPYTVMEMVSWVCVGISFVHVLALFYIPESPVYLVMKGKHNEARLTLHDFGRNEDIDEEFKLICKHANEVLLSQTKDDHGSVPKRRVIKLIRDFYRTKVLLYMQGMLKEAKLALFNLDGNKDLDKESNPIANHNEVLLETKDDHVITPKRRWRINIERKNTRGFFITTVLLCLQAGGSRMAVIYFVMAIFRSSFSMVDPNIGSVVLGLIEFCGVIWTPLLVERCGRRFMLLTSLGFCCLCMVILGIYFHLEVTDYTMPNSVRWLPHILPMLFLFAFNFGLGIVPNILSSEVYSPARRSTFCSISMVLMWLVFWITSCNFEDITNQLQNHNVFWIYAFIYAMGFFFVMCVVPETRGKNLIEIGTMLERRFIF